MEVKENVEMKEIGKEDDKEAVKYSQPNRKGWCVFYAFRSFPS